MVVATCNVGRKAGTGPTRAYLKRVEAGVPRGRNLTAILFQEIDEGDPANEHQLIRDIFTKGRGWNTAAMDTLEPLVWRDGDVTAWHRAGGTVIARSMGGIPRQSPPRKVSTTMLAADKPSDALVAFIGGHGPAGAFNGHRAAAIKARLVDGWWAHHRETKAAVRTARRAEADVVVAQDTNRRGGPKWHRRQVLATLARLIDRIAVIAGRGRRARVIRTGEIHNPTEALHPCRWAEIATQPKNTKETP